MPEYEDKPEYEHDTGSGAKRAQAVDVAGANNRADIFIQNGERVFQPCVVDSITWETQRQGAPGKLTFKVMKDEILDFAEGNIVKLIHNGKDIFLGYIFSKRRNKDGVISVTAYDQLRYLKNKNIYSFTEETASSVIRALVADFKLQVGEIEDTKYVIPKYRGSNETIVDVEDGWRGRLRSYLGSSHGHNLCNTILEKVMTDLKKGGVVLGKYNKRDVAEESRYAYKEIESVIENELDLVEPLKKLRTIGVVKG